MNAALIAAILGLVDHGITALVQARQAAQQSGEWTEDQELKFQEIKKKAFQSDAWKQDDQLPPSSRE